MVGGDDDARLRPVGQSEQPAQQPVHFAEVALGDVAVALEVALRDRRWSGGCERREDVADRVGPLEVEQGEVGRIRCPTAAVGAGGEQRLGHAAVEPRLDQDAAQRRHRVVVGARRSCVLAILRLGEPGQVGVHGRKVRRLFGRRELGPCPGGLRRREDRAGGRLGLDVEEAEKAVRNDDAIHRLRRMRRPEPQQVDPLAGPGEGIPDRRCAAIFTADRLAQARAGCEAAEIEDAVLERREAGEHRRPQERRKRRSLRLELTPCRGGAELCEVRHRPLSEKRLELLPVGTVEPDEEDRRLRHCALRELGDRARPVRESRGAGFGCLPPRRRVLAGLQQEPASEQESDDRSASHRAAS